MQQRMDAMAALARDRWPEPTPAKHAPAEAGGRGQGRTMALRAGMANRENEGPIPYNVRMDATAALARGGRPGQGMAMMIRAGMANRENAGATP